LNSALSDFLQREPMQQGEIARADIERISDDLFFVATNPAMRKLRSQAELLAQVDVPVFITGESGSGKELIARLIHKLSARSNQKFATVNCAAVPEEALENELFGHERGILNGSTRPKAGKFELCQKGTIFIEDVAEMPPSVQTKLLHAVQDKQVSRLGSEKTIAVDVRILAATDANVAQAVAQKKLREDLYYRLSAFTIHVPPLRQRNDEIPLLLACFMRQLAGQYGLPVREFSSTVLAACQKYNWPGNLRELENFVKRYLVIGDEDMTLEELAPEPRNGDGHEIHRPDPLNAFDAKSPRAPSLKSLVESVKGETERNAITAALDQTHWNRKAAARLLKVSYRTLLYKIEQYGMIKPSHLSPTSEIDGDGQA
jgi:two-component system response regulator AtoC